VPDESIKSVNLSKSFGELSAVDQLTFTVGKGEIFGLVGPDGAGKTTSIRLLTSIMEPTSGDAWISGYHISKNAEEVKKRIGYMSQRFGLYSDLTVMENIIFYADIYCVSHKTLSNRIDRLLSFSNLTPFKKRLVGNLSGGMKQKLGLVCALIHTPEILFLDEPTNGVDPVSRRDFWRILYQLLREGVTIFVSTAYLDEAERCTHLALIHKGRIIAMGTPDNVKQLARRSVLELRCEKPRIALGILREHYENESASLFGDRLHIMTQEPEKTISKTKTALLNAGMHCHEIRQVEPSLEDVFVSVLADEDERKQ
jgi:ABC-2 type transport system ATP-binding protein